MRRYFESPRFQETLENIATGSTIKNVPLKGLRRHNLDIPPIEEQRQIVRLVDSLFAVANRIEDSYYVLQKEIDQLPQSIFNKAFRGELMENEEKQLTAVEAKALYQQ
jgi:type I restriction enzyme, S subunit